MINRNKNSTARTFVTNLLLALFSIILCVVTVELGLRAYDYILSRQYPGKEKDRSVFWEYDSLLGWKFRQNVSEYFVSKKNRFRTLVKTNSKGLRDHDYAYTKEKGVKRILLLGDSVTAGLEVENERVVDSRLESYLSKNGKYEVINAGVRGYGTDQAYLWLKHEGYKYKPDIVIYIFYSNDPMNNITIHNSTAEFGKSYFTLYANNELVLNGVPVPRQFEHYDKHLTSDKIHQHFYDKKLETRRNRTISKTDRFLDKFHIGQLLEKNRFVKRVLVKLKLSALNNTIPKNPEAKRYRWRVTRSIIRSMKTFSGDIDAKFLIYESTSGIKNPADNSTTALNRLCNEQGVNYLESFKEFYNVSHGKKFFRFKYDIHWNERGHDMAAKMLYEYLIHYEWI